MAVQLHVCTASGSASTLNPCIEAHTALRRAPTCKRAVRHRLLALGVPCLLGTCAPPRRARRRACNRPGILMSLCLRVRPARPCPVCARRSRHTVSRSRRRISGVLAPPAPLRRLQLLRLSARRCARRASLLHTHRRVLPSTPCADRHQRRPRCPSVLSQATGGLVTRTQLAA